MPVVISAGDQNGICAATPNLNQAVQPYPIGGACENHVAWSNFGR